MNESPALEKKSANLNPADNYAAVIGKVFETVLAIFLSLASSSNSPGVTLLFFAHLIGFLILIWHNKHG